MRYSHKHKFILISNWKCGCSSMAQMFDGYCEPCGELRWMQSDNKQRNKCTKEIFGLPYRGIVHAPAKNIRKLFTKQDWNFDEYIKITSVRNPWARIVSLYFYQLRGSGRGVRSGGPFQRYPNNAKKKEVILSFQDYVKTIIPKWQGGIINRWNTYEMIHDDTGKSLIDYVVRLENLKEDLSPIIEKHFPDFYINYKIRANVSEHNHYSTYYDEESKSIVADLFSYDIKRWGYIFEDK